MTINYDTTETLTLTTGGGADTATVTSPAAVLTLTTGIGDDTVTVQSVTAVATVNAGDGNDAVNIGNASNSLDGIGATENVNGDGVGANQDALNVIDSGDAGNDMYAVTSTTVTRTAGGVLINYTTTEVMTLTTGAGTDNVTLGSTGAATTVSAGDGDDTVTVTGVSAGSPLTVNGDNNADTVGIIANAATVLVIGGDGNDTITIGTVAAGLDNNLAAITVTGNANSDTLVVRDDGTAFTGLTYSLNASTLSRTGGSVIAFLRIEALNLFANTDNANTVNVNQGLSLTAVSITGGAANDTLRGPNLSNSWTVNAADGGTFSQAGNATVTFSSVQKLVGGSGSDTFAFTGGAISGIAGKAIDGGAGSDRIDLSGLGGGATFTLSAINAGSIAGALVLSGFSAVESLFGTTGNDVFNMGVNFAVAGQVNGAAGTDFLGYAGYTAAVNANLSTGSASGTGGVAGIENVAGGAGNDVITGNAGNNLLLGNCGADRLIGSDGHDVLIGGAGADVLDGGIGDDMMVGAATTYDGNFTGSVGCWASKPRGCRAPRWPCGGRRWTLSPAAPGCFTRPMSSTTPRTIG